MTSRKKAASIKKVAKSRSAELERTVDPADLLRRFLTRRKARTRQSYQDSLRDFARFVEAASIADAVEQLISLDGPGANQLVLSYVLEMRTRERPNRDVGLSPNTINQRLYTIRAFTKMARMQGAIDWVVEVEGEERVAYRDTKGPGIAGFMSLVAVATDDKNDARRCRNVAILRLGFDTALRRGEVVALSYPEDVDLEAGELWVQGKKRVGRERLSLPVLTRAALARWIEQRGTEPGALFLSRDRARKGDGRLTGRGIDQIIKRLGGKLGMKRIGFHGLRHAAITYALDVTDGDIRAVQKFSRHRDPRTLMVYDDTRQDHAGRIAELVSQGSAPKVDESEDD